MKVGVKALGHGDMTITAKVYSRRAGLLIIAGGL
jgi:hypothetical protein